MKNKACAKCELRASDFPRPDNFKLYKTQGLEYCFDCFLTVESIEIGPMERTEEQKAGLDHRGMP
jgi:hypothetical protein